ncbi:NAD(P)H-dependent oxidoreductase [Stenotrophomonas rhizophila]|uniref:NAD(P)H-dependent oxidoreductase n=1 Tax=Stenotrophomonas rhizophila TaxID=216778 RepID=UPI001E4E1D1A|nr:NAD(P)H-dependent oxidoreductase [Stenotrophomonas rhizophila]MCC7635410.1 NAD(P)H-dependent oxidoreductase [Stenotrophomonas rhizophila]MCC7664361.1 NAD(P)H-dependent oxidoreductase [Stenotrophomonas rhizophila]
MRTLIVLSHPSPDSLTHAVAAAIGNGITSARPEASVTLADLSAEGFDPRYRQADVDAHHQRQPFPDDVLAEQARLDHVDTLVLVFPVYWWSMPAQLKGWIDRVFSNGWAYAEAEADGRVVKKLQRLRVHLVGLGGADQRTWSKRGYDTAMKAQIDTGIFDYCGAQVVSSTLLLEVDSTDAAPHLATAHAIGHAIG